MDAFKFYGTLSRWVQTLDAENKMSDGAVEITGQLRYVHLILLWGD